MTVSIHIEGHEDGSIDDFHDLALVLRHIADQMMNEEPALSDNEIPVEILLPYVGNCPVEIDPEDDEDTRATWSVQYGRY